MAYRLSYGLYRYTYIDMAYVVTAYIVIAYVVSEFFSRELLPIDHTGTHASDR